MKRISMNFNSSFLATIDKHAKDKGLNRTQLITFVLLTYFERLGKKEDD